MQLARTAENVHLRHLLQQIVTVTLSHAPDYGNDLFGAAYAGRLELPQPGIDLVLGVLTNAARIDDHEVRRLHLFRQLETAQQQLADDQLAIQRVHLAAHCLDVNGFRFAHWPAALSRSRRSDSLALTLSTALSFFVPRHSS